MKQAKIIFLTTQILRFQLQVVALPLTLSFFSSGLSQSLHPTKI
jgi:hypothetical protein